MWQGGSLSGWVIKGDPTEGALVVAAAKAGLRKAELEARFPRIGEIPFTSESKRMTTLHITPKAPWPTPKAPKSFLPPARAYAGRIASPS
jgi:Ca2+-transporting ATPase